MYEHPEPEIPQADAPEHDRPDHQSPEPGEPISASAEPPRRRSRRRWAAGAVAVLLILAAGYALTGLNADGEEAAAADGAATAEQTADGDEAGDEAGDGDAKAPIPVELAAVERGDVATYLTATTNLVAEGEVKILAEVEGRVERVSTDEGRYVEKGQVLAHLARQDAEIALEKARVQEQNARTVYNRGLELSKDELISAEDLDRRRLDHELAQQERKEAEWRLSRTEIRAPISGRVSLRSTQVGQHVRPGDELFQITDFDPLIARIYLSERDVLNLSPGRPVEMSLDAAPDVAFRGRIRQIAPVVDTATGTVKVTLEAAETPPQVRPGSFVTVKVIRERREGVVVLPRDAVLRELKQAHVFVAEGEGDDLHAVRREVTLGLEDGDRVQAVAGLDAGERLVVAGQGALSDGAAIRTLPSDATADATAEVTAGGARDPREG